jgi:hypothetical protein
MGSRLGLINHPRPLVANVRGHNIHRATFVPYMTSFSPRWTGSNLSGAERLCEHETVNGNEVIV